MVAEHLLQVLTCVETPLLNSRQLNQSVGFAKWACDTSA